MIRTLLTTLLFTATLANPVRGQATNVEVLGGLAVACLGEVPGDVDTFLLESGTRMPYLRPSLSEYWLERGYTVFVGDSAGGRHPGPLHKLRYDPQSASVHYKRTHGDSLRRTVDLSITHSFVSPSGMLLSEARCLESASDVVRAADVARLQQDRWEETRGSVPLDRGWRTWAEPTVIGTSLAVVVYLFFSVRS